RVIGKRLPPPRPPSERVSLVPSVFKHCARNQPPTDRKLVLITAITRDHPIWSHTLSNHAQKPQGLSYNVNRTCDYHHAFASGQRPRPAERTRDGIFFQDLGCEQLTNLGDLPRRGGPRIVSMGSDNLFCQRKQDAGDFGDGFVAHRPEDERQWPAFVARRKRRPQSPRASGIMRDVEHDFRRSVFRIRIDDLESSGPPRVANALFHVFGKNAESAVLQLLSGSDRQREI